MKAISIKHLSGLQWVRLWLMGLCLLILPRPATAAVSPIPPTPLAQIDATRLGQRLTVEGDVTGAESITSGFRLQLSDGTAQLLTLIRAADFGAIENKQQINLGARLRITGKLITNSQGQLQLVTSKSKDTTVVANGPALETRAPAYALGAMSGNDHNALVRVSGSVIAVEAAANGGKVLTLQDATGAQKVMLPAQVAKQVAAELMRPGQNLWVVGRVRATQKAGLLIQVAMPSDLQVGG